MSLSSEFENALHLKNSTRLGPDGEDESRLRWSQAAYLRSAQMKQAGLHIYVEGKDHDRYYYSKVLDNTVAAAGITPEFHLAREIRGTGEGKGRCLSFFSFLAGSDALVSKLNGETTLHLFILDKDIDDEQGLMIDSPYIIYTSHYGVENHIIHESDLHEAIAATCSMNVAAVKHSMPDRRRWLIGCCQLWQDWVALCILAKQCGSGYANYRLLSRVNMPYTAEASATLIDAQLLGIAGRCCTSVESIQEQFSLVSDHVSKVYAQGDHDKVFKGKWYGRFIAEHIRVLTGTDSTNERALWASLASLVDASDQGSKPFRDKLYTLLNVEMT